MSKSHLQEESVNLRLLSHDGLEESTPVGGDDEEELWASQGSRPFLPTSRSPSPESPFRRLGSRRVLVRAFYGVLLVAMVVLAVLVSRKPIADSIRNWRTPDVAEIELPSPSFLDHSLYVASDLSPRFRDNLNNNTKYVTSWPLGGFTNQVMAQVNLLYLSVLTLRVPVLGDFIPGHMHGNPGFLPVSEVYDLPRLAESLQKPILEWNEIKNRSAQEMDVLGCWSSHAPVFGSTAHYATEVEFRLDISLTPVPDSRFIKGRNGINIAALATLGWPAARADALSHSETEPTRNSKEIVQPDETMLCFDELYYAASVRDYEWVEDWVPAWTQVGKYMHWAPTMEQLARSFILRAFGLSPTDAFPSYISVHIRHTDFAQMCHDSDPTNCFAPLSTYGEKIDEIKAELLERHGVTVNDVLVASDEEDPAWWASVEEIGWHRIDWVAEGTEAQYSEWYPIVLDSVALSLGKGFVGTVRSTLSLLAAKRVTDWEDGPVREVTWGQGR